VIASPISSIISRCTGTDFTDNSGEKRAVAAEMQRRMGAGHRRPAPRAQRRTAAVSAAILPRFLLSAEHNIAAARGMVSRLYPAASRVTELFETVTCTTFPGLKPKKLCYQQPIYYMSDSMALVPTRTPVAFPSYSKGLDFELEIGFVLKDPPYNASPAAASAAIGAFVFLNDFSARDVQRPEMSSGLGPPSPAAACNGASAMYSRMHPATNSCCRVSFSGWTPWPAARACTKPIARA
jgi:2-keto-4-pentenoate hydratase/2-oxohepta-3-ene-1,7-dioic acid hydratase in catechol pathway